MGLTIDIFVSHLKFREIVHTHINAWLQKSECMLKKRSAADGERERVNRLLRLEQEAIGWKFKQCFQFLSLWQKAVTVATKHSGQNILVAKCTFCIL